MVCGDACWTDAACDVTDEEDDNQDSSEDHDGDNEICGHSLSTSPGFWTKDTKTKLSQIYNCFLLIYYEYSNYNF